MPIRLDNRSADFPARFAAFLATKRETAQDVEQAVRAIIDDVRNNGDRALIALSKKFDRIDLEKFGIRVAQAEIDAAAAACDRRALDALTLRARPHRGLSPAAETLGRPLHRCARRRARPPLERDRGGRALRARRHRGLSVVGADERGAGQGRGRAARRDGGAVAGRQARAVGAGGGKARRHRRGLSRRRRTGGGGAGLRHRRRSSRSRRSSAPATPMWPPRSGWCSAPSAST